MTDMKTAIEYTEKMLNMEQCNKCNAKSNYRHHTGDNVCEGKFLPALKKRQGGRVKRYRKLITQQKIKHHENLYINHCMCDLGFSHMCKPGNMIVTFKELPSFL